MTRPGYDRPPHCTVPHCTVRASGVATRGARAANVCATHGALAVEQGATYAPSLRWTKYHDQRSNA